MSNTAMGGWSPYRELTKEDKTIFEAALKGLEGVGYKPLAVKTQVVNPMSGTSYNFLCEAKVVVPNAEMYNAKIKVFAPKQGTPVVVEIKNK